MLLHYKERPFRYQPSPDYLFVGRLCLNADERRWLSEMDEHDDCWYLDNDGERLPPDQLFGASPWSWQSPSGTVKLVQRFFNASSGEVRFSTPATYFGELFDCLRQPKDST